MQQPYRNNEGPPLPPQAILPLPGRLNTFHCPCRETNDNLLQSDYWKLPVPLENEAELSSTSTPTSTTTIRPRLVFDAYTDVGITAMTYVGPGTLSRGRPNVTSGSANGAMKQQPNVTILLNWNIGHDFQHKNDSLSLRQQHPEPLRHW